MENLTSSDQYSDRLTAISQHRWKKFVGPLNPYKFHIRRISNPIVLDVGCGIGRNLDYLGRSAAVGVDHNSRSIEIARERGFTVFTDNEFFECKTTFNTILFSHVLEHMSSEEAIDIVGKYIKYLNPGGRLLIICPQEKGQKSDPTHVTLCDFHFLKNLIDHHNLELINSYSFPLPQIFGKWFIYNVSIVIATKTLGSD